MGLGGRSDKRRNEESRSLVSIILWLWAWCVGGASSIPSVGVASRDWRVMCGAAWWMMCGWCRVCDALCVLLDV